MRRGDGRDAYILYIGRRPIQPSIVALGVLPPASHITCVGRRSASDTHYHRMGVEVAAGRRQWAAPPSGEGRYCGLNTPIFAAILKKRGGARVYSPIIS